MARSCPPPRPPNPPGLPIFGKVRTGHNIRVPWACYFYTSSLSFLTVSSWDLSKVIGWITPITWSSGFLLLWQNFLLFFPILKSLHYFVLLISSEPPHSNSFHPTCASFSRLFTLDYSWRFRTSFLLSTKRFAWTWTRCQGPLTSGHLHVHV